MKTECSLDCWHMPVTSARRWKERWIWGHPELYNQSLAQKHQGPTCTPPSREERAFKTQKSTSFTHSNSGHCESGIYEDGLSKVSQTTNVELIISVLSLSLLIASKWLYRFHSPRLDCKKHFLMFADSVALKSCETARRIKAPLFKVYSRFQTREYLHQLYWKSEAFWLLRTSTGFRIWPFQIWDLVCCHTQTNPS